MLGQHYWGGAWWIVLFALFNSALAVSIACTNASTRFLYGMARAKALPSFLLKVDAKSKTPINAVLTQTGINVLLGLILPIIIGVANVYNVTGTWFTFALAFVYIVANVGLYVFYKREHPDELSVPKHIVVPAIGTIALAVVIYYSVESAAGRGRSSLAPFIVLGWLAVGIAVVFTVYRGNRSSDLKLAGLAMGEAVEHAIEERLVAPAQLPPACRRALADSEPGCGRPEGRRTLGPDIGTDTEGHEHAALHRPAASSSPAPRRASALAIVTRFLEEGAGVIALDRNADQLADRDRRASARAASPFVGDVVGPGRTAAGRSSGASPSSAGST